MQWDPGKRSAHTLVFFTLCTCMPNPSAGYVPVLVCSVLYMCVHGSRPRTEWFLTLSFAHEPPTCYQIHKHICAYAVYIRKEVALSSPSDTQACVPPSAAPWWGSSYCRHFSRYVQGMDSGTWLISSGHCHSGHSSMPEISSSPNPRSLRQSPEHQMGWWGQILASPSSEVSV